MSRRWIWKNLLIHWFLSILAIQVTFLVLMMAKIGFNYLWLYCSQTFFLVFLIVELQLAFEPEMEWRWPFGSPKYTESSGYEAPDQEPYEPEIVTIQPLLSKASLSCIIVLISNNRHNYFILDFKSLTLDRIRFKNAKTCDIFASVWLYTIVCSSWLRRIRLSVQRLYHYTVEVVAKVSKSFRKKVWTCFGQK